MENAVREIYSEYVRKASSPQVAKYAAANLQNINSPKSARFVQVASSFSRDWGNALDEFLDANGRERRDAIDSIMNNRHQIAHGRNTAISVVRVKDYLESAVEVIDFIESQCSGN